jgi:hypothetical protein
MHGQHIWHIKVRRIGRADYDETQFKHRTAPVQGEFIAMKGMGIMSSIGLPAHRTPPGIISKRIISGSSA